MSEISLSVGGRRYRIACADGEEAHVARLAETVDAKLRQMGSSRAPSDAQNLLLAALLLADELDDRAAAPPPAPASQAEDPEIAEAFERVAGSLEKCAEMLESKVGTP